jgi:hypothetical protein
MTDPLIDPVEKLNKELLKLISKHGDLSKDTIIPLCLEMVQIVESYKDLKGPQKKELVIEVLKEYAKLNLESPEEEIVLMAIDHLLPPAIDAFIAIDKKQVIIKTKNWFRDTWKSITRFFSSRFC